jgi:hypothetical protein
MEPDDLLGSRNARSKTPLVGCAQWKINQPPSRRENEQAWREHIYRSMRAGRAALATPFEEGVKGNRYAQWETEQVTPL